MSDLFFKIAKNHTFYKTKKVNNQNSKKIHWYPLKRALSYLLNTFSVAWNNRMVLDLFYNYLIQRNKKVTRITVEWLLLGCLSLGFYDSRPSQHQITLWILGLFLGEREEDLNIR